VDYFVYRAAKEIGALTAVLGGIDALVFTAGIGENNAEVRARICRDLAGFGVCLDAAANEHPDGLVSAADGKVLVAVEPTNKKWVVARAVAQQLAGQAQAS
jgi:acetate kinase